MVRDTVAPPARRGPAGLPRRRALLRRLPRQPRLRARGAAHRVRGRRRGGRAVRHQRRHAARLGRPTSSTTSSTTTGVRVGIHCHNDTGCAVANTLAAVDAGATHVQGTAQRLRRAHRQRRPRHRRRQPRAQAAAAQVLPAGPAARRRPGSRTRSPRSPTSRPPRASRTSAPRAFAHKAGLHASAIKVDPDLYQHIDPERRRQRHAAAGLRHGRPRLASSSRAASSASTWPATGSWSPGSPTGSRSWSRSGYTFEAADASFELLLVEEVEGARPSYFEVESWRVITETRSRAAEAVSEATVKLLAERRADRRHRRGQRPGQRARPGAARGDRAGLPGGREVRADRLQGAHPRPGPRHRRDHPGADRDHRRRVVVGHRRRRRTTSSRRPGARWSTASPTGCGATARRPPESRVLRRAAGAGHRPGSRGRRRRCRCWPQWC